jgi:hypothetical protein
MTTTEPLQVKWKLFIPWLESQPKDRSFDYTDNLECMICAFLLETHGVKAFVTSRLFALVGGSDGQQLPREISQALLQEASKDQDTSIITIGSVLARLKPPA